jgi:hypothetical protein
MLLLITTSQWHDRMIIVLPSQWSSRSMRGHMDHISPVVATPKKKGWSCQVESLLVGETLAGLIKEVFRDSSTMGRL